MTRKHIEALVAAIHQTAGDLDSTGLYSEGYNDGVRNAARRIARAIRNLNPAFDTARFLRDCGVTS